MGGADKLVNQLAVLEEQHGGDVAHAKFERDVIVLLNVTLADDELAVIFLGQLAHDRADQTAGDRHAKL